MTTTAEKIAVMQAYERGEDVEFYNYQLEKWMGLTGPTGMEPEWSWKKYYYRIKPKEPKVIWVWQDSSGRTHVERSLSGCPANLSAVKYREVIDEQS
tara:strand:- start:663 stop:953 length:291 start_codon:yes stop_codon:yes gene_type:complete